MTPTRHKRMWRAWHASMQELIASIAKVRALRATGRILDAEEAEGLLDLAWHERNNLRRARAQLVNTVPVKYSHISPAAADRERARRGAS